MHATELPSRRHSAIENRRDARFGERQRQVVANGRRSAQRAKEQTNLGRATVSASLFPSLRLLFPSPRPPPPRRLRRVILTARASPQQLTRFPHFALRAQRDFLNLLPACSYCVASAARDCAMCRSRSRSAPHHEFRHRRARSESTADRPAGQLLPLTLPASRLRSG